MGDEARNGDGEMKKPVLQLFLLAVSCVLVLVGSDNVACVN